MSLTEQASHVHGDAAYELGVERGRFKLSGKRVPIDIRVTNIYRREPGTWKIVHEESDMIVVRTVFIAKSGQASKLAARFKSAAAAAGIPRHRVLTDLTGESNRVVFEHEVESLGEFERQMSDYAKGEAMRTSLQGYTDLYITAHRELLQTA